MLEAPTPAAPPSDVGRLAPSFAASMRDTPLPLLLAAADDASTTTTPDSLKALIARRLAAQDAAADTLVRELHATADALAANLEAFIEAKAGGRSADAHRAAVYATRLEDLIEFLRANGLDQAEDAYYARLSRFPPLAEQTLGAIGVSDSDRALDSEGAEAALRAYLEGDREDFWDADVVGPSAARILRGLRSSIEATPLEEIARRIARDEGVAYERARFAARNNAAEYDRFVSAEAARQVDPDGETMLWGYTGPDDGVERPFCDALNGLFFTRAQVGQLDNSQGAAGHPMYACGGFNCRHQWLHADADTLAAMGFARGADSDVTAANAAAAGSR